jgi:hypothetical protein
LIKTGNKSNEEEMKTNRAAKEQIIKSTRKTMRLLETQHEKDQKRIEELELKLAKIAKVRNNDGFCRQKDEKKDNDSINNEERKTKVADLTED